MTRGDPELATRTALQAYAASCAVACAAGLMSLVWLPGIASAAEIKGQVEAGLEIDSNPHRVDATSEAAIDSAPAGLVRAGSRWEVEGTPKSGHRTRANALLVGKKFSGDDASAADAVVFAADGRYGLAVSDGAILGLGLSLYDATERGRTGIENLRRDFRTIAAQTSLTLLPDRGRTFSGTAGYRLFAYKPDSSLDYQGPFLSFAALLSFPISTQEPGERALDLRASYTIGQRTYDTNAFTNVCREGETADLLCFRATSLRRDDLYHVGGVELTWASRHLVSLGYELQWNDSSSFGESLLWHRVSLGVTSELPLELLVTARLLVQFNQFLDPLFLSQGTGATFLTVDDENRNTLLLHASRELGKSVSLEARYLFSSNEFATAEVRFRRHTTYLGAVVSF